MKFVTVRIKKRDEWKGAFMIHVSFFEPTVIFFGMTNLLATFQIIINEILKDLINEGKVATFVNDMLVRTKVEKEHNKIIKEILRRLEENDLYVKPEKYM